MMLSEQGVGGQVTGNVILANAPSKESLLELLMQDVYATSGVWDMDKVCVNLYMMAKGC